MEYLFGIAFAGSYLVFIGSCIFLLTNSDRKISLVEYKGLKFDLVYLIPLALLILTIFFAIVILKDHPTIKALYPLNYKEINNLQEENKELKSQNDKLKEGDGNKGKKLCAELANAKSFVFPKDYEYIFTDSDFTKENGIRATAIKGAWSIDRESSCESNNSDQYLKGKDISKHRIEIMQNGKFKTIGYVTAQYDSSVHISKEGKLGLRSVKEQDWMRFLPVDNIPVTDEIRDKICLYDKHRREKHNLTKEETQVKASQPCISTIGEKDHRILIAFICNGYTRIMEQDNLTNKAQDLSASQGSDLCQNKK